MHRMFKEQREDENMIGTRETQQFWPSTTGQIIQTSKTGQLGQEKMDKPSKKFGRWAAPCEKSLTTEELEHGSGQGTGKREGELTLGGRA